jgi:hypothetical protein
MVRSDVLRGAGYPPPVHAAVVDAMGHHIRPIMKYSLAMTTLLSRRALLTYLLLTVLAVPAAHAQTPAAGETATQFYLRYLAAFQKAEKIEDVLPYMAAERRKMVEETPAAERPEMFTFVKAMMGSMTDVKITKEERTSGGATLTAEAVDEDKSKVAGTITIVREDGSWKLSQESWKH